MPKDKTLKRIEAEIDAGQLGRARERLHGLLRTYPEDTAIRRRLGDVYCRLQYPEMAGRYWYLEEDETEEMRAARYAFEHACGHDPMEILLALGFRGDIEHVESDPARGMLLELRDDCGRKHGRYPDFGPRGKDRWTEEPRAKPRTRVLTFGCVLFVAICFFLLLLALAANAG